jgi:hypothetical protein
VPTINSRRDELLRQRTFHANALQHLDQEGTEWHSSEYVAGETKNLRDKIAKIDAEVSRLNTLETLKFASYVIVPLLWLALSIAAGVLIEGVVFAVMFFAGVIAAVIYAVVAAIRNGIDDREARRSRN